MKRLLLASASAAALIAGPALAQNNTSDIAQQGVGQEAVVSPTGSDSDSTIEQAGSDTLSYINQSRAINSATVTQADHYVAPVGPGSVTGDFNSNENSNALDVDQLGDNNTAVVDQTGNNFAYIRQRPVGADGNRADVTQTGASQVRVDQAGDSSTT